MSEWYGSAYNDRRIMQMVFDNRKFEKNIAKSQKSVEDFKKAMNFDETSRSLERFAESTNNLGFDRLEEYMERLTNKFTGLGDAGEYVISRIRAGFEGMARTAESFIKSLTIDQIKVGESKSDALNKAVMTVTADGTYTMEQAYAAFERLMTYTDETSYKFSDMVNQIGTLVAGGQDLMAAERFMEGVANASAKAGQGVQQASMAMVTFNKAIANGKMGLEQWNSLTQTSHIATAELQKVLADTAVELGTLEKSGDTYRVAAKYRSDANKKVIAAIQELEASNKKSAKAQEKLRELQEKKQEYDQKAIVDIKNIGPSLHNDWLTSDVMMQAINKYWFEEIDNPEADWSTFAGQAAITAQRALTLTDALEAMKESVSGGWLKSFQIFWGDLSQSMQTFTGIANRVIEIIDKIKGARNRVLESWASLGGRTSFLRILIGDYAEDIQNGALGLADLIDKAGEFVGNAMKNFFKMFVPAELRQYIDDEGFMDGFLGGKLFMITDAVSNFINQIDDYFNSSILVNGKLTSRLELLSGAAQGVVSMFTIGHEVLSGIFGFFKSIAAQLLPSGDTVLGFLSSLGITMYDSAQAAVDAKIIPTFFANLAESLKPVTSLLKNAVDGLFEFLEFILGIGNQNGTHAELFSKIGEGVQFLGNKIKTFGKGIISFFNSAVASFRYMVANGFSKRSVGEAFSNIIGIIKSRYYQALNFLSVIVPEEAKTRIQAIADAIKKFVESTVSSISKIFAKGTSKINSGGTPKDGQKAGIFDGMIAWIKNSVQKVKDFFSGNVLEGLRALMEAGSNKIEEIKNIFKNSFGAKILEFISWIAGFLKKIAVYAVTAYAAVKIFGFIRRLAGFVNTVTEGFYNISKILTKGVRIQPDVVSDKATKLLKIATAITMLVGSILAVSVVPWNQVSLAFGVVSAVIIELMMLMATINAAFKNLDGKAVLGLMGLIIAVDALIFEMIPLGLAPVEQLHQAGWAIAQLMGALVLFVSAINKWGPKGLNAGAFDGMLKLAGGIALLIFSLLPLTLIKGENAVWDFVKMGGSLIAVLFILGKFASYMDNFGGWGVGKKSMEGLPKLAGAIALLMLSLLPLGFIKLERIVQIEVAITGILSIIYGFSYFMNKYGGSGLSKNSLSGVTKLAVAMSLLIGVFAGSLYATKDIKWESIAAFALGLSVVMLAMAGTISILSKIDFWSGLKGIGLLAAAVAAILGVVSLMTPMLIGSVAEGLQQAGGKLLSAGDVISSFMANMSGIPDSDSDRAIGMIAKIKGMFQEISEIGKVSVQISSFTANLNSLGVIIQDFARKATEGDASSTVQMIERLSGTYDGLNKLSKINLSTFIGSLSGMGGAMGIYAMGAEELGSLGPGQTPSVERSIKILEDLSEGIIAHGGFKIPKGLPSNLEISTFGGQIAALALAMVDFEKAGSGLGGGTQQALDCLSLFMEIGLKLNGYDEIEGNIRKFADKDFQDDVLSKFAVNIKALGDALLTFSKSTTQIDEQTGEAKPLNFESALGTLQDFAELQTTLGDPQTVVEWFGGVRNHLETLAGDIYLASGALDRFTSTAKEMEGKKTQRDEALKAIGDFVAYVIGLNPQIEQMYGEANTLKTTAFGTEHVTVTDVTSAMNQVGDDLKGYGEGLAAIRWDSEADNQKKAIESIGNFITYANDLNGKLPRAKSLWQSVKDWVLGGNELTVEEVAGQMGRIGESLGKFGEGISGKFKSLDDVTIAMAAISGFADILNTMTTIYKYSNYGATPYIVADDLAEFVNTLIGETREVTASRDGEARLGIVYGMVEVMEKISDKMNSIKNFNGNAITSFRELAQALLFLNQIDIKKNFEDIGYWIDAGIAKGILDSAYMVTNAARVVAYQSREAAKQALRIESPSKVFADIGQYIPMGFAKGIEEGSGASVDAVRDLCGMVVDVTKWTTNWTTFGTDLMSAFIAGFSLNTDALAAAIDGSFDHNPVITPVIDLSNVKEGADYMKRAFSYSTVGIDSSVPMIYANAVNARQTTEENQNGTDLSGIYERMSKLNQDIVEMGAQIKNIKLVLDTGVLAGALTDKIDKNLGRQMYYTGRRN